MWFLGLRRETAMSSPLDPVQQTKQQDQRNNPTHDTSSYCSSVRMMCHRHRLGGLSCRSRSSRRARCSRERRTRVRVCFLPINHPYPSRLGTAGGAIRPNPAAEAAIVAFCYLHIVAFDTAAPLIKAYPFNISIKPSYMHYSLPSSSR